MTHGPWDKNWHPSGTGWGYEHKAIEWSAPPVQRADDREVVNLRRRKPAMETTIEVDRTTEDVRVLVTIGTQLTTYKLSAELAKSLGEDLFKAGCNLEAEQGATGS